MANYINIGSTCAPFSESAASYEIATGGTLFYITNGTSATSTPVLRNASTGLAYINSSSSNLVVYSDFQHKIWWNANVVTSGTGRSLWRVIGSGSASSDPIGSSNYSPGTHGLTVVSASSWASLTGTVGAAASLNPVALSADTDGAVPTTIARQTGLTIVPTFSNQGYISGTSNGATVSNVFIGMLGAPNSGLANQAGGGTAVSFTASGASSPYVSNDFYYLRSGTSSTYLRYASGALTAFDTSTSPSINKSEFQFRLFINTSIAGRIFVSLSAGNSTTTLIPLNNANVTFNGVDWRVTFAGSQYTFFGSSLPPSGSTTAPTAFPTDVTMLRFSGSSSTYLRWDGNSGNATTGRFTIADYWGSNMSSSNIIQQMQFYFGDMTPTANAAAGQTGNLDIYKWYVLTSPSALTPSFTNSSNVVTAPSGNVFVTNATTLSGTNSLNYLYTTTSNLNSEGWVLQAQNSGAVDGTTRVALVYSNVVSGNFVPVCYANVLGSTSGSSVTFQLAPGTKTWAEIPSHAYSFNCVKCTGLAGGSMCTTVAAAAPVATVSSFTGGTITSINSRVAYHYRTNGTFIVSGGGLLSVVIIVVGGGGGGGGGVGGSGGRAGGGGGGGQIIRQTLNLSPGTYNITIGTGGTAGTGGLTGTGGFAPNDGVSGGNSVFSGPGISTITANGGSGGRSGGNGGNGGNSGNGNSGGTSGSGLGGGGGGGSNAVGSNASNANGANGGSGDSGSESAWTDPNTGVTIFGYGFGGQGGALLQSGTGGGGGGGGATGGSPGNGGGGGAGSLNSPNTAQGGNGLTGNSGIVSIIIQ